MARSAASYNVVVYNTIKAYFFGDGSNVIELLQSDDEWKASSEERERERERESTRKRRMKIQRLCEEWPFNGFFLFMCGGVVLWKAKGGKGHGRGRRYHQRMITDARIRVDRMDERQGRRGEWTLRAESTE